MDITGAELIVRSLQGRPAGSVAVVGHAPALQPLAHALKAARLPHAAAAQAGFILFDYRSGLPEAAGVLAGTKAQRRGLVAVAVQVKRSLIGSGAFQPAQTRRMLDPLTKQWFHVGAAAELVELLPQAWQLAHSGRCGPVLLEVPEDVLPELVQGAWLPRAARSAPTLRAAAAALHA